VSSDDLLPERALAGDGHARRQLVSDVYQPLVSAGSGLLETLTAYLDTSGSIEATGRVLFVHPNTVRYRLKRIAEVTGLSPSEARDAYTLRLALTLGRLMAV
jgi:DNA-binding PucR family transcriptional regulator